VRTTFLFVLVLVLTNALLAQSANKETNSAAAANPQTVNAQQAGSWTVGIDTAKNSVRVTNSVAEAVPVQIVRQSYHTKIVMSIFGGGPSSGTETSINVPEGKRMVIEGISATAEVPAGERATLQVLSYADGTAGSWIYQYIPLSDQGTFGTISVLSGNHKTYASAVGRITLRARPTWTGPNGSSSVMITGYLEDLPVAP
jgi:hypothetical protein